MWNYINISDLPVMTMSGWKIYVYGEDVRDANTVSSLILPVVQRNHATCKIASGDVIMRNLLKQPAWGIAVIYLHQELFEDNKIPSFIRGLSHSLGNYKKRGCYKGSHPISYNLSIRYDLSISVTNGISYDQYLLYYRGEWGDYNIPNNKVPKALQL